MDQVIALLPSAFTIAMLGAIESLLSAVVADIMAGTKHNSNQELIGQGLGNLVGSFSMAYPTSGSFSRTAVNINMGATSGLSSVFTALIVLIALLFLTPLLYHLPQAVLAAITEALAEPVVKPREPASTRRAR